MRWPETPEFPPELMISVYRVCSVVAGEIVYRSVAHGGPKPGDIVGWLTNLPARSADGPALTVAIQLSQGPTGQKISMPLPQFLTAAEYSTSQTEPLPLGGRRRVTAGPPQVAPHPPQVEERKRWNAIGGTPPQRARS